MTLSEAEELLEKMKNALIYDLADPHPIPTSRDFIMDLLKAKEIVEREGKGHFCLAPKAFIGEGNMPEEMAPLWEDNCNGYLNVCICGGCDEAWPRLEELAKDFRLNLHFKNKDGVIKPLFELLNNPKE